MGSKLVVKILKNYLSHSREAEAQRFQDGINHRKQTMKRKNIMNREDPKSKCLKKNRQKKTGLAENPRLDYKLVKKILEYQLCTKNK
jgi:hypothetical protein